MVFNISSILSSSGQILAVLIITSVACSLIGNFLVLRKLSMVSDALAHSVLLGIVLAFFITKSINSPLLILGAAIFGVITVFAIEMISGTGLVKNDDSVGIVFPLFFSLAVILITKFARNVHIDTDVVLMGEAIMIPLNTVNILGVVLPKSLFYMGLILIVNAAFVIIYFKELKITTFDAEFATIAGFSSTLLFYILMTLTSFTSVVAFDAVGAILVISFLIAPSASAYLVTKDLKHMIIVSAIYATVNSVLGYFIAVKYNISMSGIIATVAGITFLITFLFNRNGLFTSIILKYRNRKEFKIELLIMHIGNHLGEEDEIEELGFSTIKNHLQWKADDVEKRVNKLIDQGLLARNESKKIYTLTKKGLLKYHKIKYAYGMLIK